MVLVWDKKIIEFLPSELNNSAGALHADNIGQSTSEASLNPDQLEKKKVKPRLSWYDPYDKTWVPNNWFQDGLAADMKYYFGGNEAGDAAVNGRT